jgi:hypothetical protein
MLRGKFALEPDSAAVSRRKPGDEIVRLSQHNMAKLDDASLAGLADGSLPAIGASGPGRMRGAARRGRGRAGRRRPSPALKA